MKEIGGFTIPDFPISGLKHIKDLLYHEGPLLSQYSHPSGDTYLFHWCDCDDLRNRWMVLRVNEAIAMLQAMASLKRTTFYSIHGVLTFAVPILCVRVSGPPRKRWPRWVD